MDRYLGIGPIGPGNGVNPVDQILHCNGKKWRSADSTIR